MQAMLQQQEYLKRPRSTCQFCVISVMQAGRIKHRKNYDHNGEGATQLNLSNKRDAFHPNLVCKQIFCDHQF